MVNFFSCIIAINMIAISNPLITAVPTNQDDQESFTDITEKDLISRDLSQQLAVLGTKVAERVNSFESKYVERITALETKLELYTQGWESINNAMEVVANMMKVVMKVQEQIKNNENSLHEFKTQVMEVTENTQQNIDNFKKNVSNEIILQTNHLNGKIQELADTFMNTNFTVLKTLETMSSEKYQYLENIQEINKTYISVNHSLSKKYEALQTILNENNNVHKNSTTILTDRIRSLDDMLTNKHKPIGFTYRLHPSNNLNYNANEKIHFSLKIADYGGGYNVSDGIFYCQQNGLYLFATSITTTTNGVWVYIMKNGQRIGYAYCEKSTSWASMSGSTVVSLNTGDRVWIQPHIRAHINRLSVFTGARISD